MKIEGRVWIFKDNDINTDLIYPGKYTYEPLSPKEQAAHAMEDYDPGFADKVVAGDIIVAGENFGCGSSREQAVTCLKHAGVGAVVAASFARLFYRNAINSALPVVESRDMVASFFESTDKNGSFCTDQLLTIDLTQGTIRSASGRFNFPPWSEQAMRIFEAGGLVEYTRQKLSTP